MKNLLPSLPTDNLYKFIALFGLFIFASFTILRITKDYSFREEVISFNTLAAMNLGEREELRSDIEALAKGNIPVDLKSVGYGKVMASKKELMAAIQSRLLVLNAESKDLKVRHEVLLENEKHIDKLCLLVTYISYVGIILMVFGFAAWYLKLQRYQDRLIVANWQRQAEELENKNPPEKRKVRNSGKGSDHARGQQADAADG